MRAELEADLKAAHGSGDEHRGDIDSIEAVLDRLKTGFLEGQKTYDTAGFADKLAAMKKNTL